MGIGVVIDLDDDVDEVATQVTPSRGWTPQLPGADSVHCGTVALAVVDEGDSVRTCLRGGITQGKSDDIQLGTDVELEVTEHVMSSRGGSIHGPQEKGNHESGLFSTMIMLVMIAVHEVVLSETESLSMATGVGLGTLCISGGVGA